MGKEKSENVQVILRVRPLSQKERDANHHEVVKLDIANNSVSVEEAGVDGRAWTFDAVYNNSFKQRDVYNQSIRPLVDTVLAGYNATIFAYGQSGTGKTYSMAGDLSNPDLYGIIPNALNHIFTSIEERRGDRLDFDVKASFVELYNGKCRDLLVDGRLNLELKENAQKLFYVKDLSLWDIGTVQEAMRLMEDGATRREVKATELNSDSSRSHSLFTVIVRTWDKEQDLRTEAKLNLVDLAGSERQSKTGATGDTLKEGNAINLSLTALGTVIDCLVKGRPHVPYRSTQLTMLLKDGLGGNSRTVIVGTIGPAEHNAHETVSTLRFIDRAKQIKNKPTVQMDPKDARIAELTDLVKKLKRQLGIDSDAEGSDIDEGNANRDGIQSRRKVNSLIDDELELFKQRTEELELQVQAQREAVEGAEQLQMELEAREKKAKEELAEKERRLMSEIADLRDRYSLEHDEEGDSEARDKYQQLLSLCTDFLVAVDTKKEWVDMVRKARGKVKARKTIVDGLTKSSDSEDGLEPGTLMPTIDDIRNGFRMIQANGVDMRTVIVRKRSLLVNSSADILQRSPHPPLAPPANGYARSLSPGPTLSGVRKEESTSEDYSSDEDFPTSRKYRQKQQKDKQESSKSDKDDRSEIIAVSLPKTTIMNALSAIGLTGHTLKSARLSIEVLLAEQRQKLYDVIAKRTQELFTESPLSRTETAEVMAAFESLKDEMEIDKGLFTRLKRQLAKAKSVAEKRITEVSNLKEHINTLRDELSKKTEEHQLQLDEQQSKLVQQFSKKTEQLLAKQSKAAKQERKARESREQHIKVLEEKVAKLEQQYDEKVIEFEELLKQVEDYKFDQLRRLKDVSSAFSSCSPTLSSLTPASPSCPSMPRTLAKLENAPTLGSGDHPHTAPMLPAVGRALKPSPKQGNDMLGKSYT